MSRPREFDEQAVLAQAIEVFCRQGYESTSMTELLRAMSLSKSSFYDAFGSKRELLLLALDRYRDDQLARLAALLDGDRPMRAALEAVFHELLCQEHRGACMACNEAIEMAPRDAEVARRIAGLQQAIEALFRRAVAKGQAEGSIASTRPAADLARFLSVALNGLQVLARADDDRARLEQTVGILLRMLD